MVIKSESLLPILAFAGLGLMLSSPVEAAAGGKSGNRPHRGKLCAPLFAYDTNKNGEVSPAEFAAAEAAEINAQVSSFLKKYDSDADGTVTTDEATAVFNAISADWLEDVLDCFDRDGDGAITTADFLHVPRQVVPLLEEFDSNADGDLSVLELEDAAGQISDERLERFLAKYDTDADGNVSTDEVTALIQAKVGRKFDELLLKFDADKNGTVTAKETSAVVPGKDGCH
jgi:Ca2+-binding EF-hand superfamily protein